MGYYIFIQLEGDNPTSLIAFPDKDTRDVTLDDMDRNFIEGSPIVHCGEKRIIARLIVSYEPEEIDVLK